MHEPVAWTARLEANVDSSRARNVGELSRIANSLGLLASLSGRADLAEQIMWTVMDLARPSESNLESWFDSYVNLFRLACRRPAGLPLDRVLTEVIDAAISEGRLAVSLPAGRRLQIALPATPLRALKMNAVYEALRAREDLRVIVSEREEVFHVAGAVYFELQLQEAVRRGGAFPRAQTPVEALMWLVYAETRECSPRFTDGALERLSATARELAGQTGAATRMSRIIDAVAEVAIAHGEAQVADGLFSWAYERCADDWLLRLYFKAKLEGEALPSASTIYPAAHSVTGPRLWAIWEAARAQALTQIAV